MTHGDGIRRNAAKITAGQRARLRDASSPWTPTLVSSIRPGWQTAPNNGWSGWASLGGNIPTLTALP